MLRLGAGTIPPKRLRVAVSVCGHVLTVSDLNRVLSEVPWHLADQAAAGPELRLPGAALAWPWSEESLLGLHP